MTARSKTHRFPNGWRCVFVFSLLLFVRGDLIKAGPKEERSAALFTFRGAENKIVSECIYRPKPEDVEWGILAGLARELGPDYAKYFPEELAGPVVDPERAYDFTLSRLQNELKIPPKTLITRSLRAYCRTIDRYSGYDDFETYMRWVEAGKFNLVGIGVAFMEPKKGEGFIVYPFPDGPAERSGIVGGDYLLEADGTSVKGMSKVEVFTACQGKAGTKVTIKVRHADTSEESFPVIREKVTTSPLVVEQTPSGMRVVCRNLISNQSLEDFRKLLQTRRNGEALTIDLRGCIGGDVNAAVGLASLFLPADTVIGKLETVKGQEKLISTNKAPYHPSKLIILQDRLTVSAAELVIVALVANRNLSVETRGERTYGKGVTQREVKIFADDKRTTTAGILTITDARMYGPNNEVWDGEGLAPMVEAK